MKALEFLKDIKNDTPVEWKELDKAIAELQELDSRSCESCKGFNTCGSSTKNFYCKYWEKKDASN